MVESAADARTEDVVIESDGARLAGRLYRPAGRSRATLVVHAATGVPQRYYRSFAEWAAAERDLTVLTYDYRDFGASAHRSPRHSPATMRDWGLLDQAAANAAAARLVPAGPLWTLGHSLGGMMFPFHRQPERLERILTYGSGLVHVSDHPWTYRPFALAFWYGPGALATAAFGYLPGQRLMLGADLPAGVYWQWRRWCTRRGFYRDDIGRALPSPDYAGIRAEIKMMTSVDDAVVPAKAVWRYADLFPAGRVVRRTLVPHAHGLAKLGHIEVFARRNAAVWPELIA